MVVVVSVPGPRSALFRPQQLHKHHSGSAELSQWLPSHARLAQRSNGRHCSQLVGHAIVDNHAFPLAMSEPISPQKSVPCVWLQPYRGRVEFHRSHLSLVRSLCVLSILCSIAMGRMRAINGPILTYDPYSIYGLCVSSLSMWSLTSARTNNTPVMHSP